jgi:hypothetical protein
MTIFKEFVFHEYCIKITCKFVGLQIMPSKAKSEFLGLGYCTKHGKFRMIGISFTFRKDEN